jgi:hypothetical protein
MSEQLPKVSLFSRFTRNPQWGVGHLFKQDGFKKVVNHKWFKITIGILFGAGILLSFFKQEIEIKIFQSHLTKLDNVTEQSSHTFNASELVQNQRTTSGKRGAKGEQAISLGPQIVGPSTSIIIPVGTSAIAELASGASNGPVKAKLLQNITIGSDTLVEAGATLFGRGDSSEERLFIGFQKIILPDGTVIKIRAHACDSSDQIVGLKGSKISDKTFQIAGGIGLGFIGGLSEGLENSKNVGGIEIHDNSLRDAALNGAARASLEESKELLNAAKQKKTIIEVPNKTSFVVLFDEVSPDGEK